MSPAISTELIDTIVFGTQHLEGWCPPDKAVETVELILSDRPAVVVEVGVYGGKWLIPAAMAIAQNGSGKAFAIDPWTNDACAEGGAAEDGHAWWGTTNLEATYLSFKSEVERRGLSGVVEIVRERGEIVVSRFENETIDLLHIDGNHSELVSTRDVTLWLPKLRFGGWLVMDDVNWDSVKNAVNVAKQLCDVVRDSGQWALFRKRHQ